MEFNLDTAEVPQPTLNVDTGIAPVSPPSDEVAATRSYKAHMGLGDIIKQDYDQIYRGIAGGQEDSLRENAASEITAKALQSRQQQLINLAAQKGSTLTLQDVTDLDTKPADPKSVIEDTYSRAYVNTIKDAAARIESNILTDAQVQDPLAVAAYLNKGSEILGKREYAATQAQNLQPSVDANKWYSYKDPSGSEQEHSFSMEDLKQIASLGFRNEFMLRGIADKTNKLKGGLLGENIEEQVKEILRLPDAEFKAKIDQIKSTLPPELAQKFIHQIADYSTRDKYLEDVMSASNLAVGISAAGGVRNVLREVGVRQAQTAGRRATSATNMGDLREGPDGVLRPAGEPISPTGGSGTQPELTHQQASKAVQDVVKSASAPEVTKASIAEGAGDVKEAAVQKVITSVTRPDPIKEATDTLLSLHRTDVTEITNHPGNLSREEHTRLLDAAAGFESNTVKLLTDSARVMRVPVLAEYGFRDIADRVADYFPGRQNTIMDINVRYEPVSNTHHYDIKIGNYGAVPFSSYELAARHAELNGYPLSIEGNAGTKVYLPAAAVKNLESIKTQETNTTPTVKDGYVRFYHGHYPSASPTSGGERWLTPHEDYARNYGAGGRQVSYVDIPLSELKTNPDVSAGYDNINGYPRNFNAPESIAKQLKPTSKNYHTTFHVEHDIEVVPHARPQPGLVPYNLETQKFEKPLTDQTVHIEQQGLGFHIVVSKPVNETEPFVRNALVVSKKAQSTSNVETSRLTSAANAIIGLVRNPYDTLSKVENENRAKTVFGQHRFIELVKTEMKDVEDIYKGMLGDRNVILEKPLSYLGTITGRNKIIAGDFTRALEVAQTAPDKNNLPGYYLQTPAEIQHFWELHFQRPATFKEQSAYLAIGRIDHFDHILRSTEEYKFKARLGVEQWSFHTSKDGTVTNSPWVDGVQTKSVNASRDEVTLIHDANGTERYFHSMGTNAQNEFRTAVAEGKYTGIELYNPEKRPIVRQDIEGNNLRIRYVFSNAFKRQPMTFDQIGYRGGGHWQYDYENAVKQAIIRPQRVGGKVQHIYEGDTTHSFVSSRMEGELFATAMNEISRLIKARQYKDAKNYAKTVFDQEWKDIYAGFRPAKNPVTGELQPPRFSSDPRQQFRVVPQGKTIRDLDKDLESKYTRVHKQTGAELSTFVDGTRHGSLARNFQVEFTQPRDSYALHEAINAGTVDKPFYQFRPAKLTDPISTMLRAVNRITNNTYMNDMKITAVEHWLEENKGNIDATSAEIRGSPFYYFNEGKFKSTPYNATQVLNARTNRYKIKQLLGMPSITDSAVQGVKQAISDGRYELEAKVDKNLPAGVAKVVKAPLIVPEWLLDRLSNPIDFLRGMTYHVNLGLFVPKQMVVQSMAYTTIYGIAGPLKATQGSYAALMHQWSRINKGLGITTEMGKRAELFGWKPGEFQEAMRILDRTGFGAIGNEISLDNGLHKQSFMRNDAKAFLDKGQMFFNEGNLHVRFGAWYTAFKEFRDANPVLKIGPIEEGQILYRANYLNTLMTRDANTVLNRGLVGVPFQFYDYMKKMADVFWSKNLGENFGTQLVKGEDGTFRPGSDNTAAKRALVRLRMFAMYSMLGGAVGAVGVTGLPMGDSIRKHAIEGTLPFQSAPYVKGDQVWSTMLMEGPTSYLINQLTGRFYNLNNRYNPNGLQVLRDVMQTDPKFWNIILGATGTTVGNEISSMSGYTHALSSLFETDPSKEVWKITGDDWLKPLNNIKSWSDAKKLHYALAYGKWLDSHGRPTSDVSAGDAIFRTLSGLNDQTNDDAYLQKLTEKDRKAVYQEGENEFLEQRRLAELAAKNNDFKQADAFNHNAAFALKSHNIPLEMYPQIFAKDATKNRDTIAVNEERYYLQFVPTDKQEAYRRAYQRIQELKKDK